MKEFIEQLIAHMKKQKGWCGSRTCEAVIDEIRKFTEKYKPRTNFDACCESVENMATIIDIAKVGWTKKQIVEWLQSEIKEGE